MGGKGYLMSMDRTRCNVWNEDQTYCEAIFSLLYTVLVTGLAFATLIKTVPATIAEQGNVVAFLGSTC